MDPCPLWEFVWPLIVLSVFKIFLILYIGMVLFSYIFLGSQGPFQYGNMIFSFWKSQIILSLYFLSS